MQPSVRVCGVQAVSIKLLLVFDLFMMQLYIYREDRKCFVIFVILYFLVM